MLGTSLFQIKVPGEPPRGEAAGIGNQAEEALKLFLAVSGFWTVFTQVMMLRNVDGDSGFGSAQERTSEGEAGNVLQTVGVFDGLGGALTPSEWGVAGDKNAPPMPCTARAVVSHAEFWAKPPARLARVNTANPKRYTRRRPNKSAARPPNNKKPAKVST